MKSSVIVFPGSNCDRDIAVALERMQFKNQMVWHKETSLPKSDLKLYLEVFLMEIFKIWGNCRKIKNNKRSYQSCKFRLFSVRYL